MTLIDWCAWVIWPVGGAALLALGGIWLSRHI
jgi:hypothetical protein